MYVDNRIFITPCGPFIVLAVIRTLFWAAGSDWAVPGFAAILSLLFGVVGGGFLTLFLFSEKIEIGGFYIGRPKQ